ncbi:ACT domain-containing protein [Agrococcus sp. Marseille-P2731]|uniref:ACT domain-containing protein n=1 Tax=Agrococcus sp. Marseille-P2731 TaxID=1841862 RepID=UPI0009313C4D|nr:ACT domain-containing protein [Agrococcus sp. Marseille-P2731]
MDETISVEVRIVPQRLTVLPGELAIVQTGDEGAADPGQVMARVAAPDGVTLVRRAREGDAERFVALFSGGTAHGLEAPGMTASLLAPLAAAGIGAFVVGTATADLLLVPVTSIDVATESLASAGHAIER